MKNISGSVLLGILLTLVVVYFLQPLKPGAIAFIGALCLGISSLLIKGFQSLVKRSKK
jgi:hypothetical protein